MEINLGWINKAIVRGNDLLEVTTEWSEHGKRTIAWREKTLIVECATAIAAESHAIGERSRRN